jgi:hypothetical protein
MMAGTFRKPTDSKHEPIPFTIEAGGQTYKGTLTPDGNPPAFGIPSAFVVRIPDSPRMTISIYRGEWQLPAKPALAKPLSEFIIAYYH